MGAGVMLCLHDFSGILPMPFKRLAPYAVIFLLIETLLRVSLLARGMQDVEFGAGAVVQVMALGLWFDVVTASFVLLPVMLYLLALTKGRQGGRFDRGFDKGLRFVYAYVLLFSAVSEHLFWTEFTTRFNFIAVDYLIYTQEVIGNIKESYPVEWLMVAIGFLAGMVVWASYRVFPLSVAQLGLWRRAGAMAGVVLVAAGLYVMCDIEQGRIQGNAEATEVANSGIYNLFQAAVHNEISYDRFYANDDDDTVALGVRKLLADDGLGFVHEAGRDMTRVVKAGGVEKRKNVVLVVMESMSADYMGVFGSEAGLTPNLDRLSKEGLFFTHLYATGTRTVRGLEALTLSIPPTPGQSIVRRPGNEDLFSLSAVFADRGYDTSFIYGGYGYFDNMNAFFAGNGFKVIDRNVMTGEEVQFANVWGVCDEDMFSRALREGDASYAQGKPFMQLIMTTSNHRPFTYPDGRIDIASHSNRLGGVKYADYSVGKLVEGAKKKPWFKDTVFVFVADHTAGAGGKAELDPRKYHIPMIFYAPGFIKPGRYEKLASQIDMAPVLLGMLNFSYYTRFYGVDLLKASGDVPHAFISNFQKVALVKNGKITVLSPKRQVEQFSWPDMVSQEKVDPKAKGEAIAYYQSASWWKEMHKRIPTMVKK